MVRTRTWEAATCFLSVVVSFLEVELVVTDDAVSSDELGKDGSFGAATGPDRTRDPAFLVSRE